MEKRTKAHPWNLKTPPGKSKYQMWMEQRDGLEIIHCQVGSTALYYNARCIHDLYQMLKDHGDWMLLGSKDEKAEAKVGTVEYWGRSADNPIGGWYGIRKGYRGRFANYVPPLLEVLGLVALEHNARGNRVKAI